MNIYIYINMFVCVYATFIVLCDVNPCCVPNSCEKLCVCVYGIDVASSLAKVKMMGFLVASAL